MKQLRIDCAFEGGNGRLVALTPDGADIEIAKDTAALWSQWFYVKLSGAAGQTLTLRIRNAHATTYPEGWSGYRAFVSDDGESWVRTTTDYVDGNLVIRHKAQAETVWFAYFVPYPVTRLDALLDWVRQTSGVVVRSLGPSYEGRPVHCVSVGRGAIPVWIVARQHSGETMASWWVEGFLHRLLSADPLALKLLGEMTFHIVPLANIDGAVRGHLRGSASGLDLNRQWAAPDPLAPEVAAILAAMVEQGCAAVVDVHGDETIPHVFIDGCDMDPEATPQQVAGIRRFKDALLKESSVFQVAVGYPTTYAGTGAPTMCARAVAKRFGAVGLTLEMPFKDCKEIPDTQPEWSDRTALQLGSDCLPAIAAIFGL
jgi:murein tripeptide amidase MpaA